MLNVAHFLNYCNEGGTVGIIISLMQRSKHNHVYLTYRANARRRKEFKELGLELIEFGDENQEGVLDYLASAHIDILHAQFSGGPEPGVNIGLQAGLPVVETCQAPNLPQGSSHPTVYTVPVSAGIIDYWPRGLRYAYPIYSCAEPIPEMDKFEAKKHFGFDPNRFVVGRVGRMEGLKRPVDFVYAAGIIHHFKPDVQFFLAGDGSDGLGIIDMCQKMERETGASVLTPGFLAGEEKDLAYNAIDIFLYPTSMEGFGLVFAEAMSIGLPIVTYSDPVNIDVVGPAGVFVSDNLYTNVDNPYHVLSHAVLDLLDNSREREKMKERGRRRYEDRYRPELMVAAYDKLYEEIMSGEIECCKT